MYVYIFLAPLSVCLPLKIAVKLLLLSKFSAIYTGSIIAMTQNFRNNGFVRIAEMPFMQSVFKTSLCKILSCHLIRKISLLVS